MSRSRKKKIIIIIPTWARPLNIPLDCLPFFEAEIQSPVFHAHLY